MYAEMFSENKSGYLRNEYTSKYVFFISLLTDEKGAIIKEPHISTYKASIQLHACQSVTCNIFLKIHQLI